MPDQLLPQLTYGLLVLAALLAPYLARGAAPYQASARFITRSPHRVVFAAAVALTILRGDLAPLAVCLLLPLFWKDIPGSFGRATAILLISAGLWWADQPLIIALAGIAAFLLSRIGGEPRALQPSQPKPRTLAIFIAGALVTGIAAGLVTVPFAGDKAAYMAWDHWGAYLAPAEAWLGGGAPYRDFPLQYGLGPTATLALVCGSDCWTGFYWTAVIANALYFALLAGCVVLLTRGLGRVWCWMALTALFVACFLWTGFPINVATPVMSPSVAGFRFLPLAALTLHILLDHRFRFRSDWICHLIWLAGLLWAPEAGFFTTLLWWPYLALRQAMASDSARGALLALARGALLGFIALICGVALLAMIVWALSGGLATVADFLIYVSHPPGPVPVDPVGAIWFAMVPVGLAIYLLSTSPRMPEAMPVYAGLLTFLGAGTYYLSRSYDNNILNLFPLLIVLSLSLLGALDRQSAASTSFVHGLVKAMLAAILVFPVTFGWQMWAAGLCGGTLALGPEPVVSRFTYGGPERGALGAPDAIPGLQWLDDQRVGAVLLIDDRRVMLRAAAGSGWSGVNNTANFEPLPNDVIMGYLRRGARTYGRAGWVLIRSDQGRWLALLKSAYAFDRVVPFGNYTAIHLTPRQDLTETAPAPPTALPPR